MPKSPNRAAGAGFSSALIKSVDAWVPALAEEMTEVVVFSGGGSTVFLMRSALVMEM